MHYVTHQSHQMQKHRFHVTCPDALFMETAPAHPSMKNSASTFHTHGCTGLHYVTHAPHRMQKHKFGITCPAALFMETAPSPLELET
jgi:hypothetical protein